MSHQSNAKDVAGPYILWQDFGDYEGWKPTSFNSIEEALKSGVYSPWIITKRIDFKVIEQ